MGDGVGAFVGDEVGSGVGTFVGDEVGGRVATTGAGVGVFVGGEVGSGVGAFVGEEVGGGVGVIGAGVGALVGPNDGFDEGSNDFDGSKEGCDDGFFDLNVVTTIGSDADELTVETLFSPLIGSASKSFVMDVLIASV